MFRVFSLFYLYFSLSVLGAILVSCTSFIFLLTTPAWGQTAVNSGTTIIFDPSTQAGAGSPGSVGGGGGGLGGGGGGGINGGGGGWGGGGGGGFSGGGGSFGGGGASGGW